jgi:YD repeat-containing protein
VTDGENRTWEVTSGPLGFATSITDPAELTTTYERDADGNATRIVYPSGHAEMRTYDDKGNVETLYDETLGGTTAFEYDPVSNGVSPTIQDGSDLGK